MSDPRAQISSPQSLAALVLVFFTAAVSADSLHQAAEKGDIGAIERLLAALADPNARNEDGDTPLHRAASEGHTEAVSALLAAGADLNARDSVTDPLSAARNAPTDAIAAELASAAIRGDNTALHLAADAGHVEAIGILLTAGADIDALNADGHPPPPHGRRCR